MAEKVLRTKTIFVNESELPSDQFIISPFTSNSFWNIRTRPKERPNPAAAEPWFRCDGRRRVLHKNVENSKYREWLENTCIFSQYVTIRHITIELPNELSKSCSRRYFTNDNYRQMINLKIKPFIHSFVSWLVQRSFVYNQQKKHSTASVQSLQRFTYEYVHRGRGADNIYFLKYTIKNITNLCWTASIT